MNYMLAALVILRDRSVGALTFLRASKHKFAKFIHWFLTAFSLPRCYPPQKLLCSKQCDGCSK